MTISWPVSNVDEVMRLRALAAGVTGATVTERVLDADFTTVWRLLSDFEGSFGIIEPDMRRVRVLSREGDQIELHARSRWGMRAHLVGTHRPGWFWVQSRFLIIGFAAVAGSGSTTRVAMTGGIRVPGRAALIPLGVTAAARGALTRLARAVAHDEGRGSGDDSG